MTVETWSLMLSKIMHRQDIKCSCQDSASPVSCNHGAIQLPIVQPSLENTAGFPKQKPRHVSNMQPRIEVQQDVGCACTGRVAGQSEALLIPMKSSARLGYVT